MSEATERELAQISIFLVKPDVAPENAIDLERAVKKPKFSAHHFTISDQKCRFFYFESHLAKTNPPWLDFANEQLDAAKKISFSSTSLNANGLLVIDMDGRHLIAAFGRSASALLNKKMLARDFGIRTAMNLCGNEGVRQTRTQNHSLTPTLIDRQVGQPSNSFVFGLSEAEDLKSMAAHLKSNPLVTLQGRDHLTFKGAGSAKLSWERLIAHCEDFLAAYDKDDFVHLFPNYRNFKPATDEEAAELDAELLRVLKAGEFDKLMLWVPEFRAAEDYSFSYTDHTARQNHVYPYLHPKQLEKALKPLAQLSMKKLHARRIYAYSHADERVLSNEWWSIYDCLIFEHKLDNRHFILADGEWKAVAGDFYDGVIQFVEKTVREEPAEDAYVGISIFDEKLKKNREAVFNEKVCEIRPQSILFDRAHLRIGASRKDKEFCDILDLTDDGVMRIINCKAYGASSSMSYLFAQSRFYCESFVRDQAFLTEIRKHIAASASPTKQDYLDHIPDDIRNNSGQNYRVCVWLLHDKKMKPAPTRTALPFMAQYELKLLYDQLQGISKYREIVLRFIPVEETLLTMAVKATKPKKAPAPELV